ncbi:uncharacterized protein LOC110028157 [Phalaenopsis equestris]|uniref:uncharacterized protein LOC110028157 n=1 Tax=Phalaenopsis equestris TaxID=78828 RepID=UPI0009E39B78|nr:uncharacterized protein LOC110028157 [Phalaenopsis equestris]
MGNSLRLCVACLLPCGALDVVRVVHITGHVDELSRPVTAGEILAANPGHFISKLSSQGVASHRILIVSPETELRRGNIYFLIPAAAAEKRKKQRNFEEKVVAPDQMEVKKAGHRRRQSRRVAVWRTNLESISEDL